MRRSRHSVALLLMAMLALVFLAVRRDEPGKEEGVGAGSVPAATAASGSRPPGDRPTNRLGFRRKPAPAARRAADPAPVKPETPVPVERSAAVYAAVAEGETLVTGGYRTADGRHEFVFLRPQAEPGADGQPVQIRLEAKVLCVRPDALASSGLDSLATALPDTDQHGEIWDPADVEQTLSSLGEAKGADLLTSPTLVTMPGHPFSIGIGATATNMAFELQGDIDRMADGTFAVRSKVTRRE